uniref:Uncharacterized protein n=1 Tax=Knipowitschia caucasica TaxID=637954 RepID=A0AAV2L841_KNICA
MDPPHAESKRFEAYVKSKCIQNTALSETLCFGCSTYITELPSPRPEPSSSNGVVPFCSPPHSLLQTALPSEQQSYICLRGSRVRPATPRDPVPSHYVRRDKRQ